MSAAPDTESADPSAKQVTEGGESTSPTEQPVAITTRLVEPTGEPYPYTKIRDWIPLVPHHQLSDGAFRLYYISRSLVWENTKGGTPVRPVIEVTYEEYAQILGRCAKTISRFAEDLYTLQLWEELGRTSKSIKIPGRRPQVRTVITVRVNDYPREHREQWAWDGPVKTWDVLGPIRAAKQAALTNVAADTGRTEESGQSDQRIEAARSPEPPPSPPTIAASRPGSPGGTGQNTESGQSHQHQPDAASVTAAPTVDEDPLQAVGPAETSRPAGRSGPTDLSEPGTDLSDVLDVSAGQTPQESDPKKIRDQEEKPSLPPATHAPTSLADELAMFSAPAIEVVTQLYATSLTIPHAQPLSSSDRAGLARRIDHRLGEGWSVSRIHAVLTGGSLIGVRIPGRLWASRLDDMPPYLAGPRDSAPPRTAAPPASASGPSAGAEPRRRPARSSPGSGLTHDRSRPPDPNAGKIRYEVPDGRGSRMAARWREETQATPWCGRCAPDARTLRPAHPGALPAPCPTCHPEPGAFDDTASDPASRCRTDVAAGLP